jgi:hypothetical protein
LVAAQRPVKGDAILNEYQSCGSFLPLRGIEGALGHQVVEIALNPSAIACL